MPEPGAYDFRVHHEDGGMWADSDDLPGAFAAGDTVAELAASLAEAIRLVTAVPPPQT